MTTTTSDGYIIITGASQGIGACFAEALAKRGKNLILVARSLTKVEALAASLRDKYRVRVEVLVKDLALAPSAAEVAAHCAEFSVDGLINNAGFGLGDQFAASQVPEIIGGKRGTRTLDPGIMSSRPTLTSIESCTYSEAGITGVFAHLLRFDGHRNLDTMEVVEIFNNGLPNIWPPSISASPMTSKPNSTKPSEDKTKAR